MARAGSGFHDLCLADNPAGHAVVLAERQHEMQGIHG